MPCLFHYFNYIIKYVFPFPALQCRSEEPTKDLIRSSFLFSVSFF